MIVLIEAIEAEFGKNAVNIQTKRNPDAPGGLRVILLPSYKILREGRVVNNEQRRDIIQQIRAYINTRDAEKA